MGAVGTGVGNAGTGEAATGAAGIGVGDATTRGVERMTTGAAG
jgi:hypothetical protein